MKKRWIFLSILLCLLICLSACQKKQLVNMTSRTNHQYRAIIWEDRTYVPYCVISKNRCKRQIGFVDGDQSDRVYEFPGYSSSEWIINSSRSDGGAMLCREKSVTNIPSGLVSEYSWNP